MIDTFHNKSKMRKVIRNSEMIIAQYPGEKYPVLLLHGLTGNYKQVELFSGAFQEKGHRCIVPDLKGRGESDPVMGSSSITSHALDIGRMIDELKLEKPVLVGYSMGAFIAAIVAAQREDIRGLILLDGGCVVSQENADVIGRGLARLDQTYESTAAYIKPLRANSENLGIPWNTHVSGFSRYELGPDAGRFRPVLKRQTAEEDLASMVQFSPKETFDQVACPTFLITCEGATSDWGPTFPKEAYDETFATLADLKHFHTPVSHLRLAYEEQPEIVDLLAQFLDELEG